MGADGDSTSLQVNVETLTDDVLLSCLDKMCESYSKHNFTTACPDGGPNAKTGSIGGGLSSCTAVHMPRWRWRIGKPGQPESGQRSTKHCCVLC